MRNLIGGAVGVLWGGGILIYSIAGGGPRGEGGYAAGQIAGTVFGLVLFLAGLYYLIDGVRGLRDDGEEDEPRPRRRKRKKPRVREEE